ncbi:probable ATP-dependent RNA helicase DHX35 isoform X1 [Artemia franciscana]|uniref:probable ATP-dependent RNA helicase DHX35 isoform X1 n=1 Tax=Artemia franciscana TaxID=6661 RepID=UPI0032DAB5C3
MIPFPKFIKPKDELTEDREETVVDESVSHFVYNPLHSLALDQQRKKLPVWQNRDNILYLLQEYQTLIVLGETGSGKSTQIPQYIYEAGWCKDGVIAITEPRRVAAKSLANRVAEEKGVIAGDLVGYSVRFDECTSAERTKIKYMTEGMLLREILYDPVLKPYKFIMVDEVHERTLLTDLVLGLLKKIMKQRRDLKLVISSATVDADHLCNYFDLSQEADSEAKPTASVISISGILHPVEIHYLKDPLPDYIKAAVETVVEIHKKEPPGDILVFLTGQEEVKIAVELLTDWADSLKRSYGEMMPLPMFASLGNRDQLRVFQRAPHGVRKVIVSTNVAETSVTIPNITYVVDSGFMKLRCYDPETRMDTLGVVPVSKASATQRAGRAGRTRRGKVFRLYTEESFHSLLNSNPPEMQRTDISQVVLQLNALGIKNVLRFDYLSPPPSKNLASALERLHAHGAIDDSCNLTMPLGLHLAELPLDPNLGKMLISSGDFGCSEEIASIIAMLQVESVFLTPRSGDEFTRARKAQRQYKVAEGDLITSLNVLSDYEDSGESSQWCSSNFFNRRALQRAVKIKAQLIGILKKFEVPVVQCRGNEESIMKCIATGLFMNAAYQSPSGEYRTVRGDVSVSIHPKSVLNEVQPPPLLLFVDVIHTTKRYIRDLTAVEESILKQVAPHYYK